MRIGLYARVSTTDQDCSQQLSALREYSAARNWTTEGEYVDRGFSGRKDTRPALKRIMQAARERKLDCILVWKIDRWGRSMPHLVASLQEVQSYGVRFIAVTQGIDTDGSNPTGRLMLNLLASFAEFEHSMIVERTVAGLARARREGRVGGRPRLAIDRARIERMYEEEGMTLQEIADEVRVSIGTVHSAIKAYRQHKEAPVI